MSLLSFRSVCINVLLNSGIGAEFFMTCTFGIGMLYSDISLLTYVQIVVYFLNAAFQFYTSKCAQGLLRLLWGGGRSWSATGLALSRHITFKTPISLLKLDFWIHIFLKIRWDP